jgi:hypothetical protein
MGGQKDMAKTIGAGGGDYLLAVKDTQPTLHAEMKAAFATAATPLARSPRLYPTEDHGHGREEQRTVPVLPARGHLSAAASGGVAGGAHDRPGDPRGLV